MATVTGRRTRRSRLQQVRDSPPPRRSPRLSQKYHRNATAAAGPGAHPLSAYSRSSIRTYTSNVLNESGQSVPSSFDEEDFDDRSTISSTTTASTLDSLGDDQQGRTYTQTGGSSVGKNWQLQYAATTTGSTVVTDNLTNLYGLDSDDDDEYRPHVYTVHNMERVLTPKRVSTPSRHTGSERQSYFYMIFAAIFQLFYRCGSAVYLTTTSILCYDVAILHRLTRGFRPEEHRCWHGFVVLPVVLTVLVVALIVPHLERPSPPPVVVVTSSPTAVTVTPTPTPTVMINTSALLDEMKHFMEQRLEQFRIESKRDMETYIHESVMVKLTEDLKDKIRLAVDEEKKLRDNAITALSKTINDQLSSHLAELNLSWQESMQAAIRDELVRLNISGTISKETMATLVQGMVRESKDEVMDSMAATRKNWISQVESKVSDIITALKQNIDDDLRAESEKLSRKMEGMTLDGGESLRQEVDSLVAKIKALSDEQAKLGNTTTQLSDSVHSLTDRLQEMEINVQNLESLLTKKVKDQFETSNVSLSDDTVHKIVKAKMTKLLADSELKMHEKMDQKIDAKVSEVASSAKHTDEYIQSLIDAALALYSADRIAMFDFALESAGGNVEDSSPTYDPIKMSSSVFGVTLPFSLSKTTPIVIIKPEVLPGDCWCFEGAQGFATISLSSVVKVTGISVEHIPVSLSPVGQIRSAPKAFSVLVKSNESSEGHLLGKFTYDTASSPIQTFKIPEHSQHTASQVTFQFHSNHGNPDYTCIYRVRVHGVVSPRPM